MKKQDNMIEVKEISEPIELTESEEKTLLGFGVGFLLGGVTGIVTAVTGNADMGLGIVGTITGAAGGVMLYSLYQNTKDNDAKTKVR